MRRHIRAAASVLVAGAFIALFAATSVEGFIPSDQAELTALVPLDRDGRHAATLVVTARAPRAVDEWEDPEEPWAFVELRLSLRNPDARRSLRLVDGWTGESQRVRHGATLRVPLEGCWSDPCEHEIALAFEGRRGASEPVFVTVEIGAPWGVWPESDGPRLVQLSWRPDG
jgi:hypothetical protein